MSLSVERLKELAEAMSRPIRLDGGAMSVGATKKDISDSEAAIRELIAIKEAQPVAEVCVNYSDDDRYKHAIDYSPTEIDSIAIGTQLIIKPE